MRTSAIIAAIILPIFAQSAAAQNLSCGKSPSDWCASPAGDPCGRHRTKAACMADNACHGMRYHGESVIACIFDARGFAENCPAVGCVRAPKR